MDEIAEAVNVFFDGRRCQSELVVTRRTNIPAVHNIDNFINNEPVAAEDRNVVVTLRQQHLQSMRGDKLYLRERDDARVYISTLNVTKEMCWSKHYVFDVNMPSGTANVMVVRQAQQSTMDDLYNHLFDVDDTVIYHLMTHSSQTLGIQTVVQHLTGAKEEDRPKPPSGKHRFLGWWTPNTSGVASSGRQ